MRRKVRRANTNPRTNTDTSGRTVPGETNCGKNAKKNIAIFGLEMFESAPSNRSRAIDIFLAQILGHKLLGPNASLSVGQSYKDFYIKT